MASLLYNHIESGLMLKFLVGSASEILLGFPMQFYAI